MLIGEGDLDLNLLLGFDKSLQNVLAQTVVRQDKLFRNQVTELHRLYHVQKILMQEMDQKVSSQFYFREECPNSFICMPIHMNDNFLQHHASMCLKHEQRPNLELPASFNANVSGDFLDEKCGRFTAGAFVQMKCNFDNVEASPTEELELSLRVEQCYDDLACKAKSTRRKLFTSHEVVDLDLNRALPEELSFNSMDHLISLNRNEQEIKCSNDSSNSDQQEMMGSTWTTSPSKDISEVNCKSAFGYVELPSISGPPSKSKKPGGSTKSCRPENTACQLNLPHRSCQVISTHEVNAEKHRDSSQELAEGAGSNKFSMSSKSDLIPEDISSNIKKGQCGVDMERSPATFLGHESSIPAKVSYRRNTIPSNKPKRKFQASNRKNNELPEDDILIKTGAVSLLYLSSAFSDKNQDYVPCPIRRRGMSNAARDVPQCSSESYESIVLKQPEISLDEYSVTSTPSQVNCSNEKDCGPKLKRGRRMKDFRKEILPGLASLSKQEICEDVRILRGAIKSREYKYRSKMRGTSDGFSPLKSKGSRNSNGRRRCYS